MTRKKYKQLNKTVVEAGNSHNKKKAIRTAIDITTHDIARLEDVKAKRRSNFRRRLEEWTGIPETEDIIPYVLPHERRIARLFFISGIICILLEAIFAVFPTMRMGLPWWSGVIVAVLFAMVLHGGLTMAFRQSQQPRATYQTLRRWLLVPAFVLVVASILLLLVARAATGWLLLMLLPLLTVSLWTATAGLLILGAALLVASDIYNWATRDTAEYAAVDSEQRHSVNYRREFEEDLTEIEKREAQPSVSAQAKSNTNGKSKSGLAGSHFIPIVLFSALLAFSTACETTSGSVKAINENVSETLVVQKDIDIYIDDSRSGTENAYRQAAGNLHSTLPRIIENQNAGKLTISNFAEDGWNAHQRLEIDLPKLILPKPEKSDLGEFTGLESVEEAQQEQDEAQLAERQDQARSSYRSEVKNKLAPVTEQSFQPTVRPNGIGGARCTDIFGVLRRVAASTTPRVAIVVTDGSDTCNSQLNQIPAPNKEVILIIVLVPENNVRGQRSFEVRQRQLAAVCPWAVIVPHFEEDLNSIINTAVNKRASNENPVVPQWTAGFFFCFKF